MQKFVFVITVMLMVMSITSVKASVIQDDLAEENCLALNIYFESRGEPLVGQIAVGLVTLRRVHSDKYPNSICEVVYEPMQFSWTMEKRSVIKEKIAWIQSKILARFLMNKNNINTIFDPTGGAMYFHSYKILPKWARQKFRTVRISKHIFYAERQSGM